MKKPRADLSVELKEFWLMGFFLWWDQRKRKVSRKCARNWGKSRKIGGRTLRKKGERVSFLNPYIVRILLKKMKRKSKHNSVKAQLLFQFVLLQKITEDAIISCLNEKKNLKLLPH